MTNDLLKLAIEAHGGLARWNAFRTLEAEMSITGAIWHIKQKPDMFRHIVAAIDMHAQRVEIRSFTAPDRHSSFTPGRIAVESTDGRVLESRDNPRSSFAGHSQQTPWDDLHAAYFCSYALWTYFSTPFLYTYPGVATEELSPWHEDGEQWRRLKVTFPGSIDGVPFSIAEGLLSPLKRTFPRRFWASVTGRVLPIVAGRSGREVDGNASTQPQEI
jgi:hypothetical protein